MIRVHFIVEGGEKFAVRLLDQIPRVGDELRFTRDRFFTVTRVVWCYDEDTPRVNIGMVPG